jgi:hypothetical protein
LHFCHVLRRYSCDTCGFETYQEVLFSFGLACSALPSFCSHDVTLGRQVINDSFMPTAKCDQCDANQITSKVTMQVKLSSIAACCCSFLLSLLLLLLLLLLSSSSSPDPRLQIREIPRRPTPRSSLASASWSRATNVHGAHAGRQHASLLARRHCQPHWHFPSRSHYWL